MADPSSIRIGEFYETLEQIGEGTYGQVYKAKHIHTNEIVALKRIRMENEKEGFPITAIREIKILRELQHENVVRLKDIVTDRKGKDPTDKDKGSIYLVFEYMDHDLAGLMDSPVNRFFKPEQIKCYMKQMLQGLHVLHSNHILHRDIKASNLLINNKGILKLADFGLARPIIQNTDNAARYTNNVITLWYRPPELLLGAERYGTHVDMWSVGCILAELLYKKPIFPGKTEVEQLDLIWRLCGTPTPEVWPNVENMRWWKDFRPKKVHRPRLREVFKDFPPAALDLVEHLLALDPAKRISASEALDHDYFWTEPYPCDPSALPQYPSCHEWNVKKRKHMDPAALSAASSGGSSGARPSSSSAGTEPPPSKRYKPSSSNGPSGGPPPMMTYPHPPSGGPVQPRGPHGGYGHHGHSQQGHEQPPPHHHHNQQQQHQHHQGQHPQQHQQPPRPHHQHSGGPPPHFSHPQQQQHRGPMPQQPPPRHMQQHHHHHASGPPPQQHPPYPGAHHQQHPYPQHRPAQGPRGGYPPPPPPAGGPGPNHHGHPYQGR